MEVSNETATSPKSTNNTAAVKEFTVSIGPERGEAFRNAMQKGLVRMHLAVGPSVVTCIRHVDSLQPGML